MTFNYQGTGTILISGDAEYASYYYFSHQSIGSIQIFKGEYCGSLLSLSYNYNYNSNWLNIGSEDPNFSLELESTWEIDSGEYHWYRVIACNQKKPISENKTDCCINFGSPTPTKTTTPTTTPTTTLPTPTPTPTPTKTPLQRWYEQKCACTEQEVSPSMAGGCLTDIYETTDTDCGSKNLFVMVAAQNLKQVCETLKNPIFGPKVDYKLSSIKKNVNPIGAGSTNNFVEQDFCSCPECLEFCTDFDFASSNYQKCVKYEPIGVYMSVVDKIYSYDPSLLNVGGQLRLGGSSDILRYWFSNNSGDKGYLATESYVIISSESSLKLLIDYSIGIIKISGSAEVVSTAYSHVPDGIIYATSDDLDFIITPLLRNSSGAILIGGLTSDVVSSSFYYRSSGGLQISSILDYKLALKYEVSNCTDQVNIGGSSEVYILKLNYENIASGSVELSGSSLVISNYYSYEPTSSIIELFGSSNDIVAGYRSYVSQGSINLGGSINRIYRRYRAQGIIDIFGTFDDVYRVSRFKSTGGIIIGGRSADVVSPDQVYTSNGKISTSGSAIYNFVNLGILSTYSEVYAAIFGSKLESSIKESDAALISGFVDVCGCEYSSPTLNLTHNISRSGVLYDFLTRNNFKISDNLQLTYKKLTNAWSNSLHYKGKGMDGKSLENWYINFELACTDQIATQNYSNSYFRFNLFVRRQEPSKNISTKTNLYFNIAANKMCVNRNISSTLVFNSFLKTFTVDGINNQSGKIVDEIGLFKNSYWNNSKNYSDVRSGLSKTPTVTGIFPTFKINIPVAKSATRIALEIT